MSLQTHATAVWAVAAVIFLMLASALLLHTCGGWPALRSALFGVTTRMSAQISDPQKHQDSAHQDSAHQDSAHQDSAHQDGAQYAQQPIVRMQEEQMQEKKAPAERPRAQRGSCNETGDAVQDLEQPHLQPSLQLGQPLRQQLGQPLRHQARVKQIGLLYVDNKHQSARRLCQQLQQLPRVRGSDVGPEVDKFAGGQMPSGQIAANSQMPTLNASSKPLVETFGFDYVKDEEDVARHRRTLGAIDALPLAVVGTTHCGPMNFSSMNCGSMNCNPACDNDVASRVPLVCRHSRSTQSLPSLLSVPSLPSMPRLPYLLTDGREKGREKDNARMTPQMSESDMIVKWPEERGLQPCLPSFAVRERVAYVRANHRTYHAASGVLHVPVNLRNCIGFELVEASITRTHYSIESPYNVVTVRVAADAEGDDVRTYALTLAVRDYTATQLKDALNSLLASTVSTTNVPGSTVYGSTHVTVTVDADTKKFKFTCTGTDSMEYCALEFSDKHLAYITGFPPASAYTGPTDSDGTDRFEARDEEAKFYPARTSALALTYALSTSAAGGLPSAGQFDLSGSRYLRLECAQLERAYSNSGVIKDLPFADDVTFATQVDPSFLRKFVDPADLGRLRINLQVLTPDAGAITYNNNGLAFYLTFAVTTLVRARERATDAFVD